MRIEIYFHLQINVQMVQNGLMIRIYKYNITKWSNDKDEIYFHLQIYVQMVQNGLNGLMIRIYKYNIKNNNRFIWNTIILIIQQFQIYML